MTREDTVIGIRIKASGRPSEKAVKVVTALADLCRETLIRTLAQEQIGQRMAQVNDEARLSLLEQVKLRVELESLAKQNEELARLRREFPAADASGGRQVVDTREGGHRYLPLAVQLVGVRAKMADNAYELRVEEHLSSLGARRLRLLQELSARLDAQALDGSPEADTLSVVDGVLKRFVAELPGDDADLAALRREAENLASTLSSFSKATTLVPPSVNRKARVPAMAGAAALAAVLVLAGALLGESWRRLHASS